LLTRIFTRANIAVGRPVREIEVKSKPDAPPEDDSALLRKALRGVRPLAAPPRVHSEAPKPRPRARLSRAEQLAGLEDVPRGAPDEPPLAAADPTLFARPGVTQAALRKLRRGQYPIQAELDLHGLTAAAATVQLRQFLVAAVERDARCLRIVHGKGLRSGAHGPVLRQLVNGELRRMAAVQAFTSARPVDGGTGAVYVLLRART
jgi:DNA-nicking Smr family endonuclease